MEKQVGKSDVFTKESLRKLQDKMRMLCIESFNKEYGLINSLKGKKKGRNRDYHITEMDNYMEMKEQLEKNCLSELVKLENLLEMKLLPVILLLEQESLSRWSLNFSVSQVQK